MGNILLKVCCLDMDGINHAPSTAKKYTNVAAELMAAAEPPQLATSSSGRRLTKNKRRRQAVAAETSELLASARWHSAPKRRANSCGYLLCTKPTSEDGRIILVFRDKSVTCAFG